MEKKTIQQMVDLSGRKALVTGAAGHVGSTICDTLLELGCTVAGFDKTASAMESRPNFLPMGVDLSEESQTRKGVKQAIAELGGLDILVHAAAYVGTTQKTGWGVPFEEQTLDAWQEALQIDVASGFVLAQETAPTLKKSNHASIIYVGSIYGSVGPDWDLYEGTKMANPAAYNVSKGGLLQLSRYCATLLAPEIRVNVVSPGGIERGQPEKFQKRYQQKTPLRRMATEEDLKGAIAYLASDLSRYVTGHNLMVDGGFSII